MDYWIVFIKDKIKYYKLIWKNIYNVLLSKNIFGLEYYILYEFICVKVLFYLICLNVCIVLMKKYLEWYLWNSYFGELIREEGMGYYIFYFVFRYCFYFKYYLDGINIWFCI